MENEKYRNIWNKLIEELNDKYYFTWEDSDDCIYAWVRRDKEAREAEVVLYYYVKRGDLEAHYFMDTDVLIPKEAANHPIVHTSSCDAEIEFHMSLDDEADVPSVLDWFSVFFKEIDK